MAYSMYEHSLMKTEKHVRYFPEENDYTEQNYNHLQSPRTVTKMKKFPHSIMYENERKCPIYIHQFNKSPISSIYANYSSINEPNHIQSKKPSRPNYNKPQNSKQVLDKLEETYWATWKPSKDSKMKTNYENQKYGKTTRGKLAEKLIKYFEVPDFLTTSASATETETVQPSNTYKQYESITQEIQTDDLYPVTFTEYDSTVQIASEPTESTENIPEETETKTASQETVSEYQREPEVNVVEEPTKENKPETEITEEYRKKGYVEITSDESLHTSNEGSITCSNKNEEKKILNHTDSFIITKKKQSLVKEYLQQPRSIKLYKKTVSSYLKGGSYPLKPCLKKETTVRGNFRLGAPGSPLFVTGSSFSRKNVK